jgi:hypothetical protein
MRAVLLSLLRRLRSHLSYRAATQRLNTTFRDVHPAALAAAGAGGAADCTICMDEIVHVGKQLPCGHVFHLSCLRAWLQQSGSESFTCPNCRKPILVGAADGADGGGQRRRRESSWWLVRTLDRLYVRLVVALEPLVLTMLLRYGAIRPTAASQHVVRQDGRASGQGGEGKPWCATALLYGT